MRLRDGVAMAELEYGTALLDERSGEYWNLNPTGALVLRTLLAGGEKEAAIEKILSQYDVERDVVHRDVEHVLRELRSTGLLEMQVT